jgi:thioredoxin-related protein
MKILWCVLVIAPLLGKTQTMDTSHLGIQWTSDLNWQQIKEKAKAENKYIFLDCFTTWCGPCKQMDKNVYVNDSVGDYFNQRFIAVKVQMDKTMNDNDQVRHWYPDAKVIANEYRIEAYPTFIFLSPAGIVVHKETGYKDVLDFLKIAQIAIEPGNKYKDPYKEYDRLVWDYKHGVQHYDSMLYMIKTALKFDTTLVQPLLKSYTDYLMTLSVEKRYTKENIEFWSQFVLSSKTRAFNFFYRDGAKIDKVMKQKGYAAAEVDKTIFNELIISFMKEQNKNKSLALTGMYVGGTIQKPDYSEANWKALTRIIREKFNRQCAKRNVLAARIEWYKRHNNAYLFTKYSLLKFKKYPPAPKQKMVYINDVGWNAFLHVTDKKMLTEVISYTQYEAKKALKNCFLLDTYANLLYKVGRKEDAIAWEQKAIEVAKAPFLGDYKIIKEKMNRGEPTYGVKPL